MNEAQTDGVSMTIGRSAVLVTIDHSRDVNGSILGPITLGGIEQTRALGLVSPVGRRLHHGHKTNHSN